MENHSIAWVGMDTDTRNNQVAVYRGWNKEPAAEWIAGMDRKGIQNLIERLKKEPSEVRCVYEAGPCGYELYRKLRKANIHCDVIAPSLTPSKPGDHVKTNRKGHQSETRPIRKQGREGPGPDAPKGRRNSRGDRESD